MTFDWRTRPVVGLDELRNRFEGQLGDAEWRALIDALFQPGRPQEVIPTNRAFDEFLRAIRGAQRPTSCCVFVSHRMTDVLLATQIAYIVVNEGYDYWLDVHDPQLAQATRLGIPSPIPDILIAAIIEVALLNAIHIIAAHTVQSAGSKWIPYELGRAKERIPVSLQAAGYFASPITPTHCGEYTYLAVQTHSKADILQWLKNARTSTCQRTTVRWPDEPPGDLP